MIIGMDFGTTNSGIAVHDNGTRLLPIDSANPLAPHIVPTMLYISKRHEYSIGRQAVNEYYAKNQGRPIRLKRQYVGTIQLTYAELGTFYRDVFVWVDELEPGRLFRSMKSSLQDVDYVGTSVWGRFYRLEDLVGTFLLLSKLRAEQALGEPVAEIVLGRPVKFSDDPKADRIAEERLARAAILAGFQRVHMELEPVAAAFQYEQSLSKPQRILVFDFGGGTLDITIMEVDGSGKRRVLSTDGVRIAGDVFDQKIVVARLAPHLGAEVTYGPKALRMPRHIIADLPDWQTLSLLNRPDILSHLAEIERATAQPGPVRALQSLISNNYGLKMLDEVERAKIALSTARQSTIRLAGKDISIQETISRAEFEQIIRSEMAAVSACVDGALAAAALRPRQIDAVIRTGGSSLIPCFQQMLTAKFGSDKLAAIDEFSSVTSGLAVAAGLIAQGKLELRSYSDDILKQGALVAEPPNFQSPVLKLREQMAEWGEFPSASAPA